MLGTYVLSAGYYDAYYLKAQQVRTLILRDYERAFERVDAVAMPTSPTPAFRLGERVADPLQMYLGDVFTVSANLARPAGDQRAVRIHRQPVSPKLGTASSSEGGLPVGLQLTGRRIRRSDAAASRGRLRTRHDVVEAGASGNPCLNRPGRRSATRTC